MHFPWLYEPQLVDVSDVVVELEKKHGKVLSSADETAQVKGVWRAVPQYHGFFVATYREDLFKKASLKVPDTWEDLYTVGKELKKMGNPVGIPISQNYDPSPPRARPVVVRWHGGRQGRPDRPDQLAGDRPDDRVVPEDVPRLHGARGPVLGQREQQRVAQAGKAGWIHNPVSAYIVARNRKIVTADGINHHRSLAGPHGRHETDVPRAHRDLEVLEERRAGEGVDPAT